MPRKKKIKEEITFSKYQLDIFDFVEHGVGNAVIEAVPGAGKSFTLVECLKHIPDDSKILVTAFNTDIVDELKKKIKKEKIKKNVECRTIHSLGYSILTSNYKGKINPEPDNFKYSSYIYNNIKELGGEVYASLPHRDHAKYIENIKKLVDFGRYYLCESKTDLINVATTYDVSLFGNEPDIALEVMAWGKEHFETIDFTDMVWLPIVLNCKSYGKMFDWIIGDEIQDLEKQELELLLRCTKMGTRMLFAGEKQQCLYAFKGSNAQSFKEICELPNTIKLPLSISYRCGKNIVKFANKFNQHMQPKENAEDGEIKFGVDIDEIEDGDMVLCRVNAPLLQLYCELAKRGKTAYIRGNDIGSDLIKVIKKTKEKQLFQNLKGVGVFSKLYNDIFDEIDSVMRKNQITFDMACEDAKVCQIYDTIQALEAISEGLVNADELILKLKELFSDKKKKGISLSTIHKAKGLEADNVFICCPSLMPAQSAKLSWELQQEANLEYVAYTRAKKKLAFLKEDMFTQYSSNSNQKAATLQSKKDLIFILHGDSKRCGVIVPTKEAAKHIVEKSKDVKFQPKNARVFTSNTKPTVYSSISDFKGKKRIKRRIKL